MTRKNGIDITHEAILAALEQSHMSVVEICNATGYSKGKVDYSLRILLVTDEAHCCGLQPSASKGQKRKVYAWGPNPNPPEEGDEEGEVPPPRQTAPIKPSALHPMLAWGIA